MKQFSKRKTAVIGLDASGIAACKLLQTQGARVCAVKSEGVGPSQKETKELTALGIEFFSEKNLPADINLAVHSSLVSRKDPLAQMFATRAIEVISDLELASRRLFCLSVAICGTNGKTTTAELVAEMLAGAQRKTIRAGASGAPVCGVTALSRELDFVTLDVNPFQLESIEQFRPSVAVITNIRGDHMDKYANMAEYARVIGRVFKNQQVFDWAIVQSEALAHLRSLGVEIPSKVITFSAQHRRADIYLDRGLLISSLANWAGPLFNMEQCALRGPHHAENAMAALAVGRVLRLNLEEMIATLKTYQPGPHRSELVREIHGVKYVNNSKAMNVAAVQQSIEAIASGQTGEPNIWLIAGGRDKMLDYHELGPVLAQRVKGAFFAWRIT